METDDRQNKQIGSIDECEVYEICEVVVACGMCCRECEAVFECEDMCIFV